MCHLGDYFLMQGMNDDRYKVWRNDGRIGFVHLAFRVIITAINDFFYGDVDNMLSAAIFFENSGNSTFNYWSNILGMDTAPIITIIESYYLTGEKPSPETIAAIDNAYNLMTIDYKN